MKSLFKKFSPSVLALFVVLLVGCGWAVAESTSEWQSQIDDKANHYKPFIPPYPGVEHDNYTKAQKLYASPNTIIYCTAFPSNPSAPLITVPIQGKLTSSSVSVFPSTRANGGGSDESEYTPERRSVDGMYHGSPPPYRYGFTPGGQYVDFFNLETLCTTQPTEFQRQKTTIDVSVSPEAAAADNQAQQALKNGNRAEAERILKEALSR